MKFLIVAIAASLTFPAAVSAETWWLMIGGSSDYLGAILEKVPTTSEEECEEAGQKIFKSKDLESPYDIHGKWVLKNVRYICVKGK